MSSHQLAGSAEEFEYPWSHILPGGGAPTIANLAYRTALFTFAYTTLHFLSEAVWFAFLRNRQEVYARMDRANRVALSEKICSTVNALITAVCGFYITFISQDFGTPETVLGYTAPRNLVLTEFFVSAFLGYMIYDLGTMIVQGKNHWTFWAHHIIGFYHSAALMYYRTLCIFALVYSHTELTALPNNLIWYFQYLSKEKAVPPTSDPIDDQTTELPPSEAESKSTRKKRLALPPPNLWLLWARFVGMIVFRFWVSPFVFYYTATLTPGGVSGIFSFMFGKNSTVPFSFAIMTMVDVTGLSLINIAWTWASYKSWQSAKRKALKDSKPQKKE
ncbi:hypothetical protein BJ742DRAFT_782810 [Cladochytrium replicatum]|nr:hypothetical protein BJ742DRAFT_782810 [Cladochytrium replicatum]